MNRLICGAAVYVIDEAYRTGARACRNGIPDAANPHRCGSRAHRQWAAGHRLERHREHIRFGVDVLAVPAGQDISFEHDTTPPRDADGCVDAAWYAEVLPQMGGLQPVTGFMRQWRLELLDRPAAGRSGRYRISQEGQLLDPGFSTRDAALSWVGRNRKQLRRRAITSCERLSQIQNMPLTL